MRTATIKIKGLTPYSQSQAFQTEKNSGETHDDFDTRAWREHLHVNAAGKVFIPAVAITQGMSDAASYLGKGGNLKKKGAAHWGENFRCGLAVAQGPEIDASEPRPERVYCHADGQRRGKGGRVWRRFPMFDSWKATLVIHILDDSIPEDVFMKVLDAFGLFIGIGRFRPQNNGYLGRFVVEDFTIR